MYTSFGATPPPKPPTRAPSKLAPQGYQPPLPPGVEPASSSSSLALYMGLGAAALVLVGGIYMLVRK